MDNSREIEITTWMKSNILFESLPAAALEELIQHAHLQQFPQGHLLISENRENQTLFMLISGQVNVISNGTPTATAAAGDTIGEISTSRISPPVADVIANTGIEVIAFPIEVIDQISEKHPDFGQRLRQTGISKVYGRDS